MTLRKWREEIRQDPELQPMSKLVAYTLATYAEADGHTAAPGYEQLGDDIGRSIVTVQRAIKELREAGYLLEEHKGHAHGRGYSCGYFTTHRLIEPSRKGALV